MDLFMLIEQIKMKRIPKKSYNYIKKVFESNGADLD